MQQDQPEGKKVQKRHVGTKAAGRFKYDAKQTPDYLCVSASQEIRIGKKESHLGLGIGC